MQAALTHFVTNLLRAGLRRVISSTSRTTLSSISLTELLEIQDGPRCSLLLAINHIELSHFRVSKSSRSGNGSTLF